MLQALAQNFFVAVQHFVEPGVFLLLRLFQYGHAHAGHNRQGYNQAGQQAVCNGQGHVREQFSGQAAGKHHGQKHADGGDGGSRDRAGHLLCALHRRPGRRYPAAPQTVDVLDDDHRVIHQHTNAQRQAGQRDHVQRHAAEVHQHNGRQHAEGNAEGYHDGGLYVLQEEGQHDHRQQSAPDQVAQHAVHDQLDVIALIHQRGNVQAGVFLLQLCNGLVAGLGNLAGARGGALEDGQHHRVVAVYLCVGIARIVDHGQRGHIAQAHIADAVNAAQQNALQLVHALKVFAHAQQPLVVAAVSGLDVTGRHIKVLRRDHAGQGAHVQQAVQIGIFQRLFAGFFVVVVGIVQLIEAVVDLVLRTVQLILGGIQLALGVAELGVAAAEARGRLQLARLDLLIQLGDLLRAHAGGSLHLLEGQVQHGQPLLDLLGAGSHGRIVAAVGVGGRRGRAVQVDQIGTGGKAVAHRTVDLLEHAVARAVLGAHGGNHRQRLVKAHL